MLRNVSVLSVKGPRGKEKWKNLPVDKLPDSLTSLWIELMVPCRKALSQMVKCLKPNLVVAVGDYAKKR